MGSCFSISRLPDYSITRSWEGVPPPHLIPLIPIWRTLQPDPAFFLRGPFVSLWLPRGRFLLFNFPITRLLNYPILGGGTPPRLIPLIPIWRRLQPLLIRDSSAIIRLELLFPIFLPIFLISENQWHQCSSAARFFRSLRCRAMTAIATIPPAVSLCPRFSSSSNDLKYRCLPSIPASWDVATIARDVSDGAQVLGNKCRVHGIAPSLPHVLGTCLWKVSTKFLFVDAPNYPKYRLFCSLPPLIYSSPLRPDRRNELMQ